MAEGGGRLVGRRVRRHHGDLPNRPLSRLHAYDASFRRSPPTRRGQPVAGPAAPGRLFVASAGPASSRTAPGSARVAAGPTGRPGRRQQHPDARVGAGGHAVPLRRQYARDRLRLQRLVTYVYKDVLALPRTSRELAAIQGPRIPPERLATGDLVFFGSGGSVTHVAFMSVKVASSMPPPPAVRSAWIFLMELTGATTIQVQSGFCTEMSLSS